MDARTVGAVLLLVGCGPAGGEAPPIDTDAPGWGEYDHTFGEVEPPADTGEPEPVDTGEPFDADGDGFPAAEDCDDVDPDVHPEGLDLCGDDVDEDCSGAPRTCERVWFTGDVTWNSEEDVRAFCAAYTAIDGDLTLATDSTDLAAAACLVEVTGDVRFDLYAAPGTTRGLGSLESIGGDLVFHAYDLWRIEGFGRLETVGGDLTIAGTSRLGHVEGFRALQHVGGTLTLRTLSQNEHLPDFVRLVTVQGEVRVESGGCGKAPGAPRFPHLERARAVHLHCAGASREVDGYGSLVDVWGEGISILTGERDVVVSGFGALGHVDALSVDVPGIALTGFGKLARVRLLALDTRDQPIDAPGLGSLVEVTEQLTVEDYAPGTPLRALRRVGALRLHRPAEDDVLNWLPALEEVDGELYARDTRFDDLSGAAALRVVGGDLVLPRYRAELRGLPALEEVGGDIEMDGAPLSAIPLLDGVQRIGGSLDLAGSKLTDLDDLGSLVEVGGDLDLSQTLHLVDATGLAALVTVGGSLTLDNAPALTDFDLSSLWLVGGDLTLSRLRHWEDSQVLGSLEAVGGDLILHQLIQLREVDGLASLRTVGGDLRVTSVQKLTDATGLHGVTDIGGDLALAGNLWLSEAEEAALVTALEPVVAGDVRTD